MENIVAQEQYEKKGRALKVMLLFAIGSIAMVFAGLTSAYVVSKSRPDWLADFVLPIDFTISTVAIVISSVTMHLALKATKEGNVKSGTIYLISTLILGLLFVFLQFKGFGQVISEGYFFTGSESTITTSFLYVIVIVHIAHLFGGMISLLVVIYNHFKQKYNAEQYVGIQLCAWFWHFLDILWVYLFLFFTFFK
ncbi:cytochrome c oxidase subunit 3 [Myroides odoratus]|jgi:cytochrome c oxidase subunit 3|uniref:Cytochrome c oxidase subunit 3 n=1 Tax=Myroides odoratus TaxID=256 RepID=A0A378U5E2_MYROD|nr:cytochrome c oxidase subunit 3 [Myroides odoratus]MDR0224010.1 cytochrome c oxidase subunit 3 [Myroides odoratus]QQU02940.1 cytochrome c oxidase subunit 3 [Myroides odoratus]STZ69824.1 Cytochrome c oxidase subunit 3 [Myroides odoratus]